LGRNKLALPIEAMDAIPLGQMLAGFWSTTLFRLA
jgi:hypothetical protein